ncbi:unnamed protein product [Dovyalis caffra]|uniref:Uncharacterized protein n=1 Tax=Dovyalis caffra TaxID=77055 RepID=A0AAV1RIJ6_9ROSI|nr:unnamed protein product [Dovyalis caffra]
MCRTTDFHGLQSRTQEKHLKIKSFYVRFTGFKPDNKPVPESLTHVYLPRAHDLIIDGSKIRPESKAFLGLHRIVNVDKKEGQGEVVFGSRERVRVGEGVRFEVYLREERVLEGSFRRDADLEKWKLECSCGGDVGEVRAEEVCVAVEGDVTLVEKVVKRKKKSRRGFDRLEVIPEEREVVEDESDGGCCCDCDGWGMYGGDMEEGCGPDCEKVEMEMKSVRWAVDVGVWVMCLGVGFMVSRASAKSLRRLRLL